MTHYEGYLPPSLSFLPGKELLHRRFIHTQPLAPWATLSQLLVILRVIDENDIDPAEGEIR